MKGMKKHVEPWGVPLLAKAGRRHLRARARPAPLPPCPRPFSGNDDPPCLWVLPALATPVSLLSIVPSSSALALALSSFTSSAPSSGSAITTPGPNPANRPLRSRVDERQKMTGTEQFELNAEAFADLMAVIVGMVCALLMALAAGLVATRSIVRPTFTMIGYMQKLMAGIEAEGNAQRTPARGAAAAAFAASRALPRADL